MSKKEQCEYCRNFFHHKHIYKHRAYCPDNPNRKSSYKTGKIERLKKFKKQFPEFYKIFTHEQLENYLGLNETEVKDKI